MEHKHTKKERIWNTNGTQKIAETIVNKAV
jgi:hypothetical protein